MLENPSVDRDTVDTCSSRLRSPVTNGKTPFVEADGRGAWARRWRDVVAEITSDLGGADLLSEGQKQLIRGAAIAVVCEKLEGQAASGVAIDLEIYGRLTERLGRTFHGLGLKCQPRDVMPTLSKYLAALRQSKAKANKPATEEGRAGRKAVHREASALANEGAAHG